MSGYLLFIIGLIILVGSLVAAVVFACIYQFRSHRLNARLDAEYGKTC